MTHIYLNRSVIEILLNLNLNRVSAENDIRLVIFLVESKKKNEKFQFLLK